MKSLKTLKSLSQLLPICFHQIIQSNPFFGNLPSSWRIVDLVLHYLFSMEQQQNISNWVFVCLIQFQWALSPIFHFNELIQPAHLSVCSECRCGYCPNNTVMTGNFYWLILYSWQFTFVISIFKRHHHCLLMFKGAVCRNKQVASAWCDVDRWRHTAEDELTNLNRSVEHFWFYDYCVTCYTTEDFTVQILTEGCKMNM